MYYTTKEVYEFIGQQTSDPIVEWKICAISGQEFPIYQSDRKFYDKISPVLGGKKYEIPLPTICPEERQREKLLFRNERKLYRRKCDATGEDIISIYSPDKPYKVYKQEFRLSDKWDPMTYGRDFDFTKNFTEQFKALHIQVPKINIQLINCENCNYSNIATSAKNCYLSSVNSWSEDVHYSSRVVHSKTTQDSYKCGNIEESFNCYKVNHSSYIFCSSHIVNSHHCYHSSHLDGCSDCFNCHNLVNKQYYIDNIFVGKEKFEELLPSLWKASNTRLITNTGINAQFHNFNSDQCIGDNLTDSTNCAFCFDVLSGTDCKYYYDAGGKQKDCFDNSYGGDATLCLGNLSCMGYGHMFSTFPWYGERVLYSDACQHCNNVFGCVGLNHKSYCIFNKQYTKEEYEVLVPQIIGYMESTGERGKFIDSSISPFAYNETVAQDYFPLSKEEALAKGYRRQDNNYDPTIPEGIETLKDNQIPTDITTVTDDILKKILICEVSGRPFRIIKQELDFYRTHGIALPRKHPDIRHQERQRERSPRELHLRTCDHCGITMISVYSSEYVGEIYCEACYNQEIYG